MRKSSRVLTTVDYYRFCASHGIEPGGLHCFQHGGKPSLLISGEIMSYVEPAVSYKFGSCTCKASEGLLLQWSCEHERDRFYVICAYDLRGQIPEYWDAVTRGH